MIVPVILWERSMQRFLATRIAEVEYDDTVYYPALDRYDATGEHVPDDVSSRAQALTDARCAAEEALIQTPTNSVANLKWKIAYARKRYEDFCDLPESAWEAIHADLDRIIAEREA
jgi:hypothetical protein